MKKALWATILYNLGVIEDASCEHDLRQKASNALVQAALAYSRVVEQHEMQQQMTTLEHVVHGNGYGHS